MAYNREVVILVHCEYSYNNIKLFIRRKRLFNLNDSRRKSLCRNMSVFCCCLVILNDGRSVFFYTTGVKHKAHVIFDVARDGLRDIQSPFSFKRMSERKNILCFYFEANYFFPAVCSLSFTLRSRRNRSELSRCFTRRTICDDSLHSRWKRRRGDVAYRHGNSSSPPHHHRRNNHDFCFVHVEELSQTLVPGFILLILHIIL